VTSYGHTFDPAVWDWIAVFYALALGQNTITTGLMAFRLWLVDRRSKAYNVGQSQFFSTMLLLIESAALYFVLQVLVLAAFLAKSNIQLVLLGSIPPIVVSPISSRALNWLKISQGITFTLVTIRVAFRSRPSTEGSSQTPTIGSLGRRDLGIEIKISEEVIVAKHDSEDSPV
jgi:hypothetical protein